MADVEGGRGGIDSDIDAYPFPQHKLSDLVFCAGDVLDITTFLQDVPKVWYLSLFDQLCPFVPLYLCLILLLQE